MKNQAKISLFQAKIVKKLENLALPERKSDELVREFKRGRQYIYQNLRDLKDFGLLEEIKRGRINFYNPTKDASVLASKRIDEEIHKRLAQGGDFNED